MTANESQMNPTAAGPNASPQPPQTPAARLLGTLAGAGSLAGLLIVIVYQLTLPAIEAKRARELAAGIEEVLQGPASYTTLYLYDDGLVEELPETVDPRGIDRVYLGHHQDGRRAGFAIAAAEPGFADLIEIIFGYDPQTRQVLGMRVLETKETPGLGDKIESDQGFLSTLIGGVVPMRAVKPGTAQAPEEVNMITGATISARTVMNIINNAVERWTPYLEAYQGSSTGGGER